MVICWAQSPSDRPSASQIVSIASAPEFTHLQDVVSLNHLSPIIASLAVPLCKVLPNGKHTITGAYQKWIRKFILNFPSFFFLCYKFDSLQVLKLRMKTNAVVKYG